jgi:ParB-like chromosome segregation protein Spo0J
MAVLRFQVSKLKENPNNPRVIKDNAFKKLVKSIQEFPEMLNVRPLVVNSDYEVLGGNMRLKALKEAGIKEVPIEVVDWTPEQQKEFVIKDNLSYGEWNYELLANEWEFESLTEWGLTIPGLPDTTGSLELENYFADSDGELEEDVKPSSMDDGYSKYELIMLHENKLKFLEVLNRVKAQKGLDKQEDALMEIIISYEKHNRG